MLTHKDVAVYLADRMLRRVYRPGGALPPVRALAAELGCSRSTVGRAFADLQRQGWLHVEARRGAVVASRLPEGSTIEEGVRETLGRLALRWALAGRSQSGFENLMRSVLTDVFRPRLQAYFLECNSNDLQDMAEQVRVHMRIRVTPLLLDEVREHVARLRGAIVLTPIFHLGEARELVPPDARLVPLSFVPADETALELATLPTGIRVGVIAAHERGRLRLEGVVRQYTAATVTSAIAGEQGKIDRLLRLSDVIVTNNAAGFPSDVLQLSKRVIRMRFVLEPTTPHMLSVLSDPQLTESHSRA